MDLRTKVFWMLVFIIYATYTIYVLWFSGASQTFSLLPSKLTQVFDQALLIWLLCCKFLVVSSIVWNNRIRHHEISELRSMKLIIVLVIVLVIYIN